MEQKIFELINRYGYFGIFSLITAENLFPPIPSEIILTAGGLLTTCTSMSVIGVTLFSTFGSVLGAILLYYLGHFFSQDKILIFIQSPVGRLLHFRVEDVLRTIEGFRKRGSKSVFFCRFVPILRSLISIPAGICKMDPLTFLLYTTAGSLGWNFILVYMGSVLGSHLDYFLYLYNTYSTVVKIFILLFLAFWIYKKVKTKISKR